MCSERDQHFYEPQMWLSQQHGDAGYSANATNSFSFCLHEQNNYKLQHLQFQLLRLEILFQQLHLW